MEIINDVYTLRDEDFGLKVDIFGHESKVSRHSHDFIEFTFIDQGFTMHGVEGEKTSLLLPGDMLYVLPGTAHEYWRSTNNKVLNCLFYPKVLGEDLTSLIQLPLMNKVLVQETDIKCGKIHLKSDYRYTISELLKKIQNEGSSRQVGWKIRSKALLIDFLVCISRVWDEDENMECVNQDIPYTPYGMIQVLETSQKDRMSVEEMAKAMGYSPEHFSRVFKKLTGISPSTYLTNMRIASAAEKLMDERLSIAEVAEMTGFEDINYFSRIFKKETGKTPSEFRSNKF